MNSQILYMVVLLWASTLFAKVNLNTTDSLAAEVSLYSEKSEYTPSQSKEKIEFVEVEELDSGTVIRPGLLLSGGYEECALHIGILRSIEKYKIPVDYIYGSSWGALVAAFWSVGYSADEIEEIFIAHDLFLMIQEGGGAPTSWSTARGRLNFDFTITTGDSTTTLVPTIKEGREVALLAMIIAEYIVPRVYQMGGSLDSTLIPLRILVSDQKSRAPAIISTENISTALLTSILDAGNRSVLHIDTNIFFDANIYARFPVDWVLQQGEVNWLMAVDVESEKPQSVSTPEKQRKFFRQIAAAYPTPDLYFTDNVLLLKPYSYDGDEVLADLILLGEQLVKRNLDDIFRVYNGSFIHREFRQYDQGRTVFTMGQTPLSTLAPEYHGYVNHFLKYYPDTFTTQNLAQIVQDLYKSPYLHHPKVSLVAHVDTSVTDIEVESQVQEHLQVSVGMFSTIGYFPHVWGGVQYGFVNQFEYVFSASGWIGDYARGALLGIYLNALGGSRFYFSIEQKFSQLKSNELRSGLGEQSPIQLENQDSLRFIAGYWFSRKSNLYAQIDLDNSVYTIEYPGEYYSELLRTPIKGFGITLGGRCETAEEGEFSRTGFLTHITTGFLAEGFPDSTIQYPVPLHVRAQIDQRVYVNPYKGFVLSGGISGGLDMDYSHFGSTPQSFRSSLENFPNYDAITAQRYKIPFKPTLLSRIQYEPNYYSHGFSYGVASVGYVFSSVGYWIRGHFYQNYDDGGRYLNGFSHRETVESIVRISVKSVEFMLFVESMLTSKYSNTFGFTLGTRPF